MADRFYRATMRIGDSTLFGRLIFGFLVLCAIGVGAAAGLMFVYSTDLPQIHALENYRPITETQLFSDDGQQIGAFSLQRRILVTYEQIPKILREAIISTEDQHFEQHWGVDFARVVESAWTDLLARRPVEGASTLTMQLAGGLFLNRADRTMRRKVEETLLALEIERHYTKAQIFTMYCNQIYLGSGNYGFEAASEFYFGKHLDQINLPEAALLAAIIRGPYYSPIYHPKRALARRNLVLYLMRRDHRITRAQEEAARKLPLGLHLEPPRDTLAPYFIEEIRQHLEHTYGTAAVHEQGLRVYTTLNVKMQEAADEALRDGLHAYDRRRGWRGHLQNVFTDHLGTLKTYHSDNWDGPIHVGQYVTGLVMEVSRSHADIKIGKYHARLTPADMAWTGYKSPKRILVVGDLVNVHINSLSGDVAHIQLEQIPQAQAALIAIDNATGEIKAMVGGYSFRLSKFNRATQAMRQTGSSFKVYVYSEALLQGANPFDTILDEPVTYEVGDTQYSPHDYDDTFEGRVTLRRALADSLNVPAVRLLDRVGIQNVIGLARKFGIVSPLPPYLPLALGAADLTLIEHTSAFTVFPDDGIHIKPYDIRRVTSYEGSLLEEHHPVVTEVIPSSVARTMVAMLEDVVNFGTGVRAKALGRPSAGKTGTTNNFTDAWYIGFTPRLTCGVWVGNDNPAISLGNKETGARVALPIWLEFMKKALKGKSVEQFPNVVPLEQQAPLHAVDVDTPDTAPPADTAEQGFTPVSAPQSTPQGAAPNSAPAPNAAPAQKNSTARPLAPTPVAPPPAH